MSISRQEANVSVNPSAPALALPRLRFGGGLELARAGEREIFFLVLVCFMDMMTTLWWVETGRATEANPFLQWTFHFHPVLFVLVKLLSTLPACYFALKLAQRYPQFTTWLLRMVLAAYVFLYIGNL